MIQHIKLLPLIIALLLCCQVEGNVTSSSSVKAKSKAQDSISYYTFKKAFISCYGKYESITLKEAQTLYSGETIRVKLNKENFSSVDWETEGDEKSILEECISANTNTILLAPLKVKTGASFPLDEGIVYGSNANILFLHSGYIFLFIKSNNPEFNKYQNMENTIKFSDLFNEGSIINFSPEDLESTSDSLISEFYDDLKQFEATENLEDFDVNDLSICINNNTFTNSTHYINSQWLGYFLEKYKVDVNSASTLFRQAIEQEDFDAVKTFISRGYITDYQDVLSANGRYKEVNYYKKYPKGIDSDGEPTFYDSSYSKIDSIEPYVIDHFKRIITKDPDGYVNLRKEGGADTQVIGRVTSGQRVEVIEKEGNWWEVNTPLGKGFIHKSRLTLLK